jgi:hypothetical protein
MSPASPKASRQELSPDRIIELKHQLSSAPGLTKWVAVHLAIGSVEAAYGADMRNDDSYTFAKEVGAMALDCHELIQSALAMRNDEWPAESYVKPEDIDQVMVAAIAGGARG